MTLNYQEAREYVISQPFIEEIGFHDILRFNPYALKKVPTILDNVESALGRCKKTSLEKGFEEYPIIKNCLEGLFERPEGTYDIFLNSASSENFIPRELESIGTNLTSTSLFEDLTKIGFHMQHPKEFLYLCNELRLKQEIAKRLSVKYNLSCESLDFDSGIVVTSIKNPTYNDINSLLNFCMVYHGITNNNQFKDSIKKLSLNINKKINSLSKILLEK